MRKKGFLFSFMPLFFLAASFFASCKGARFSIVEVQPYVVYIPLEGKADNQYLFVFVRTEDCEDIKSMDLYDKKSSLRWQSVDVHRASDNFFYAVFSPSKYSPIQPSDYMLAVSDFYGGSARMSFSLAYDKLDATGQESFTQRYALYDKDGRLEIFSEIDEDIAMSAGQKKIMGKRLCHIFQDGRTLRLFPYEEIK